MPHHKRAAAPQTSLPSIPSLLCFERSALVSCTSPDTRTGKSALAQRAWAGHLLFILKEIISHTINNSNMTAIALDNKAIPYSNVVKNLGLYLYSNLNWNAQIK